MLKITLEKNIAPGSLRWIGQNYNGLLPSELPIAAKNLNCIAKHTRLPLYKFRRFKIENIVIAHDSDRICYIYVNPKYGNYRKAFSEIVNIPDNFHVDHILSRKTASILNLKYVLLGVVPAFVNIRHGFFEKIPPVSRNDEFDVCFADVRILDKVLMRNPKSRRKTEEINQAYNSEVRIPFGLTLKQKGTWNSTFGFNVIDMEQLIRSTREI